MKMKFISLLLILSAGLVFAAGQGEAASDGPTELVFMHFKTGNEAGALPDIVQRFNDTHPDINVTVEAIATSAGFSDALKTRLTAELDADVFMFENADFDNFAAAGYLRDISDSDAVARVLAPIRGRYSRDGNIYAVTMSNAALGMYANMDILEEAGVESLPTNWDEFLAACEQVKDAGYLPWVMGNRVRTWSAYHSFENAMYAEHLPTEELDQAIMDGDVSIADLWEPYLERIQTLIDNEYINVQDSMGMAWNQEAFSEFLNGEAAFMYGGSWQISLINDSGVDLNAKFFASPLVDGVAPRAHLLTSTPVSVNAHSQHPEAAMEFFNFLFEAQSINDYVISQSAFTPIEGGESVEDPIAEPMAATVAAGDVFLWPKELSTGSFIDDWRDGLSELILGVKTPAEMADTFERQYDQKVLLSQ